MAYRRPTNSGFTCLYCQISVHLSMYNFRKYKAAMAVWLGTMFVLTTFVFPYMGWSDNKIGWGPVIINLVIWGGGYFGMIWYQKRRLKQFNNQSDEKMD